MFDIGNNIPNWFRFNIILLQNKTSMGCKKFTFIIFLIYWRNIYTYDPGRIYIWTMAQKSHISDMLQFNSTCMMQSLLFWSPILFISFDLHNDIIDFRHLNSWKLQTQNPRGSEASLFINPVLPTTKNNNPTTSVYISTMRNRKDVIKYPILWAARQ